MPSSSASGATRDLAGTLAASDEGQTVIAGQRYGVVKPIRAGDTVAVEPVWSGRLTVRAAGWPT